MKAFKAGGEGFDSSFQPQAAHMDFIQLKPGPLIATGRDLDIHMNDHTVLGVQAPNGETAFTRRGDLKSPSMACCKPVMDTLSWARATPRSPFRLT